MGNNWVVQDHYALGSRKRTLMSWDEWMRRRCPNVHLEAVEEAQNEGGQFEKAGHPG